MSRTPLVEEGEAVPVAFNGPFLMNVFLESQAIFDEEYDGKTYREIQTAVSERLGGAEDGWGHPQSGDRGNDLVYDVDDYEGNPITPYYFVHKTLTGDELEDALSVPMEDGGYTVDEEGDLGGSGRPVGKLRLQSVLIRFHDFGTGTVTTDAEFEPADSLGVEEYRDVIESISSDLPRILDPLIEDWCGALEEALDDSYIRFETPDMQHRETRQLLWTHRIFKVGTSENLPLEEAKTVCRSLVPTYKQPGLEDCSIHDSIVYYTSVGNSVAIYDPPASGPDDVTALQRIIALQNAYWAGAVTIGELLFKIINEVSLRRDEMGIEDLREQSSKVLRNYDELTFFRSVLRNHVTQFSPQNTLLWRSLTDAWNTEEELRFVDERLDSLEEVHARLMSRLSNEQSHRLNLLVVGFTVLTGVSAIVVALQFTQGGGLQWPPGTRAMTLMVVVAVVGLVAVGLYWYPSQAPDNRFR